MIETEVRENTLRFKWTYEVPCFKGHELWIKYDVDISKTPRHVANFTFAMIMFDTFLYQNSPIIFDELTLKEKKCIENHLKMAYSSKGCCGTIYDDVLTLNGIPQIYMLKTADDDPPEEDGPVLVSNGFGKDALNSLSLSTEMGFETRGFTVGVHTSQNAWTERMEVARKLTNIKGVEPNIVLTNFFDIRPHEYMGKPLINVGFYPYFYGLPLAYAYDSDVILGATEIHNSKFHAETMAPACAPESIFSADYFTKATGIKLSSPLRAVTEYGSQKLFSERYPKLKHLQRSCDRGVPYCNHCSKCSRTALNLTADGRDPTEIGLVPYKDNPLDTSFYHRHIGADRAVKKKLRGEPYETWVEGANENVFKHIWMGKELKNIIGEHLPIYDYDPGLDDGGYVLAPSKWGVLLKHGLVYFMEHQ